MKEKFTRIFLPYVVVLMVLVVGYSLLHWALFIERDVFSVKEGTANFLLPMLLAAAASLLFLMPKARLLKFRSEKTNQRYGYFFIGFLALVVPLAIAQEYLVTATGKLTRLHSINDINRVKPSRYYTLENYYIHKAALSAHRSHHTSGKHRRSFVMELYITVPVFEAGKDTLQDEPLGWLGFRYSETISNRRSDAEKADALNYFEAISRYNFGIKPVDGFEYLERLDYGRRYAGDYTDAVKHNQRYYPGGVVLKSVYEPFEKRNTHTLIGFFVATFISMLVWLAMSLIPSLKGPERQWW